MKASKITGSEMAPKRRKPVVARRSGKAYRLELQFGRAATVRLVGDVDLLAAADLEKLFASLDELAATIDIDLSEVVFLDSSGLAPLMEATRRRRARQLPPMMIIGCSRPARRLLDCLGCQPGASLDLDAWDRLASTN